MDWIGILIAGLSGAVAAAIAGLMVGFKRESKGIYVVILLVLFLVIKGAAQIYVEPNVRGWEAEREIRAIPFYKDLSIQDPIIYQRVKAIIYESVRNGDSKERISSRIADVIGDVLPRYVPKASDDSVVAYLNLMVSQLAALHEANPDACYAFMFPHNYGEPGLAQKYIDSKAQQKDLEVLTNIVESSISNPQSEPDASRSNELLQPVIAALVEKHGRDVSLLQGPAKDSIERGKVCEIASEMYRQIASLPKADASLVLRYLLSSKTQQQSK